jgi:hypothetical protein
MAYRGALFFGYVIAWLEFGPYTSRPSVTLTPEQETNVCCWIAWLKAAKTANW